METQLSRPQGGTEKALIHADEKKEELATDLREWTRTGDGNRCAKILLAGEDFGLGNTEKV
jgi:hypothetical protein